MGTRISKTAYLKEVGRTRPRRMKWWKDARFGMFIHWGPYAMIGRNEWAMNIEAWPREEYEALAGKWKPKPGFADEWAKLAKKAGMKYMVLTTRHLDGFCLWDSDVTDYCAGKMGPRRDLVAEYVRACRKNGLRVGFYFSTVDWHFRPSAQQCITNPEAARKSIDYAKGLLSELLANYGEVDILWYDAGWPFPNPDKIGVEVNSLVRRLQPEIVINNRGMLEEDFSTPEGSVHAVKSEGRGWEACMTFNHTSWGYMPSAACDSHSTRDIIKMLYTCAVDDGNLLLNIGPAPDGSVPKEAVEPLTNVGKWLRKNRDVIFDGLERVNLRAPSISACIMLSRKGKRTLQMWVKNWPGRRMILGGFKTTLRSASFAATGKPIAFEQTKRRIVLGGLPKSDPDKSAGITLITLEFASRPAITENSAWFLRVDV